jgi:putative restriction endonuclease
VTYTPADEFAVRDAAMAYVGECARKSGGIVTRPELEAFEFRNEPIKLIDKSRGIRNPRQLAATLTILASPNSGYADDVVDDNGLMSYAYRTGSGDVGDNVKLRRARELGLPVILLRKIADGVFVPFFPVYIEEDRPQEGIVAIKVDTSLRVVSGGGEDQRRYVVRELRQRVHQRVFSASVLRAYRTQCAICRLRHVELLDAAHIIEDSAGGQPVVPNGLSLCKIHHAAFDANIVGVRDDYVVEVRTSVLDEIDGPMLRHGLQEIHGWRLELPARHMDRPSREALAERYAAFTRAS